MTSNSQISVVREAETRNEQQVSTAPIEALSKEFEWEENPEFFVVLVESLKESVQLFNAYSPRFIVSAVSESSEEIDYVWNQSNAPFVGDGLTRWVDGQFALLRPELGLSNWENGRLFARSGILSGDSAFTIRLRVRQSDKNLHR
jgi:glutamate-5-semialdehyde dehydrogenase